MELDREEDRALPYRKSKLRRNIWWIVKFELEAKSTFKHLRLHYYQYNPIALVSVVESTPAIPLIMSFNHGLRRWSICGSGPPIAMRDLQLISVTNYGISKAHLFGFMIITQSPHYPWHALIQILFKKMEPARMITWYLVKLYLYSTYRSSWKWVS